MRRCFQLDAFALWILFITTVLPLVLFKSLLSHLMLAVGLVPKCRCAACSEKLQFARLMPWSRLFGEWQEYWGCVRWIAGERGLDLPPPSWWFPGPPPGWTPPDQDQFPEPMPPDHREK